MDISNIGDEHPYCLNPALPLPNTPKTAAPLAFGMPVTKTSENGAADCDQKKELTYKEWSSLYQKTATVITNRLILSHPCSSDEEFSLVEQLNKEFRAGDSYWTVLEIPEETPKEIMEELLEIKKRGGDFFSRTWFIQAKTTEAFIGMLQTSTLNESGLSEIDRHILKQYCRTGYGSEALNEIYNTYGQFSNQKMLMPTLPQYKERILPSLKAIADYYLKDSADDFLKKFESADESTGYFVSDNVSKFPLKIIPIISQALASLGNKTDCTQIKGLKSYALTEASTRSLRKCNFKKTGEDKWAKYYA